MPRRGAAPAQPVGIQALRGWHRPAARPRGLVYDEALRHERQSAVDARQFAAERVDEARRKAHEAEVLVAGYTARLEARDLRIAELEAQITDMKAEVHNARRLAEELKHKADDAEFSPLDAILQMDQALDVIGKTADRFGQ